VVHLQESRQELAGLPVEASSERAMLITHMIQQNRMFGHAAVENGSQDLARILRAFEPILVQLAADDISPEEAEALQAQLAFELNVVLTKFGRNASDGTGPI
jgi:DNA-binding FadR family transcriptional regulator